MKWPPLTDLNCPSLHQFTVIQIILDQTLTSPKRALTRLVDERTLDIACNVVGLKPKNEKMLLRMIIFWDHNS